MSDTPSPAELRQWADNPATGSRMVPVHPNTLRNIADALAARDAEIERLRAALQYTVDNAWVLTDTDGDKYSVCEIDVALAAIAQTKEPT
jgi:hypothetical protein